MNSHEIIKEKPFSTEICDMLSNRYLESQHLNFRCKINLKDKAFVCVLFLDDR